MQIPKLENCKVSIVECVHRIFQTTETLHQLPSQQKSYQVATTSSYDLHTAAYKPTKVWFPAGQSALCARVFSFVFNFVLIKCRLRNSKQDVYFFHRRVIVSLKFRRSVSEPPTAIGLMLICAYTCVYLLCKFH